MSSCVMSGSIVTGMSRAVSGTVVRAGISCMRSLAAVSNGMPGSVTHSMIGAVTAMPAVPGAVMARAVPVMPLRDQSRTHGNAKVGSAQNARSAVDNAQSLDVSHQLCFALKLSFFL